MKLANILADCDSIKNFKEEVDGHIVHHRKQSAQKSFQHDFDCTCEEYTKNPYRYCTHINKVKHKLCAWSQAIDGDKPLLKNDEWTCPKCNESVSLSITFTQYNY